MHTRTRVYVSKLDAKVSNRCNSRIPYPIMLKVKTACVINSHIFGEILLKNDQLLFFVRHFLFFQKYLFPL